MEDIDHLWLKHSILNKWVQQQLQDTSDTKRSCDQGPWSPHALDQAEAAITTIRTNRADKYELMMVAARLQFDLDHQLENSKEIRSRYFASERRAQQSERQAQHLSHNNLKLQDELADAKEEAYAEKLRSHELERQLEEEEVRAGELERQLEAERLRACELERLLQESHEQQEEMADWLEILAVEGWQPGHYTSGRTSPALDAAQEEDLHCQQQQKSGIDSGDSSGDSSSALQTSALQQQLPYSASPFAPFAMEACAEEGPQTPVPWLEIAIPTGCCSPAAAAALGGSGGSMDSLCRQWLRLELVPVDAEVISLIPAEFGIHNSLKDRAAEERAVLCWLRSSRDSTPFGEEQQQQPEGGSCMPAAAAAVTAASFGCKDTASLLPAAVQVRRLSLSSDDELVPVAADLMARLSQANSTLQARDTQVASLRAENEILRQHIDDIMQLGGASDEAALPVVEEEEVDAEEGGRWY